MKKPISAMRIMILKLFIFVSTLLVSASSFAVVQQHTFSVSGDHGETGMGTFTWDDTTIPDGNELDQNDMLSFYMSISGGNVNGSPAVFNKADCLLLTANTPDFLLPDGLAITCIKGPNEIVSLSAPPSSISLLVGPPSSTLTFIPQSTMPLVAPSIPAMSVWGLGILAGLLSLTGFVRRRKG